MKSGIYQILNNVNGKTYIGQTINFHKRKTRHLWSLKNNSHDNYHLQRAYNKYGLDNFIFFELIKCPNEELDKTEQYLVDFYQPKYNICKDIVTSCLGIKRLQKTKDKISNSHKGKKLSLEHRESLSRAHLGLKQSPETIEKRMLKVRGRKLTEEQLIKKRLMSTSCKPISKICPKTNIILEEYTSITEAAKLNNLHIEAVGNCVRGKTLTSGGFFWQFKENKL